jgi:hypothetical protein
MQTLTYTELCSLILENGEKVSPRGELTYELRNANLQFESGCFFYRVGLNGALCFAEGVMMCAGLFDLELIRKVAPNANIDLYRHQSDYGPRLLPQFHRVYNELKSDQFTRRAVLYFNNRDTQSHDLACTSSIQFFIRENLYLDSVVTMRSWDAVYGLPMDIVMFGMLQQMFANSLNLYDGNINVNVGSLHIYEKTKHKAYEVSKPSDFSLQREITSGFDNWIGYFDSVYKTLLNCDGDVGWSRKQWPSFLDYYPNSEYANEIKLFE